MFFRIVSSFEFLLLQMKKEHLHGFIVLFIDGVQEAVTDLNVVRQKTLKREQREKI